MTVCMCLFGSNQKWVWGWPAVLVRCPDSSITVHRREENGEGWSPRHQPFTGQPYYYQPVKRKYAAHKGCLSHHIFADFSDSSLNLFYPSCYLFYHPVHHPPTMWLVFTVWLEPASPQTRNIKAQELGPDRGQRPHVSRVPVSGREKGEILKGRKWRQDTKNTEFFIILHFNYICFCCEINLHVCFSFS